MDQYVRLDVSLKEASISVRQSRNRIWRGKFHHSRATKFSSYFFAVVCF
jgi:hypothetical protein